MAKKKEAPAAAPVEKERVLRVGVIGQGRSGRNMHTEFLKDYSKKFKIVAVCDFLKDRCDRAKKEYGCKTYQDYHKMFNDKSLKLDLIVNSSFSHMHPLIAKEAMLAGYDVITEKPLGQTADEIRELISVSKTTGRILAPFQQSRFAPYYQTVCNVIRSGVLGNIKMIKVAFNGFSRRYDWQTLQSFHAGGLYNTGPHPLDQVLGLIGRDIMPNVWCKMDTVTTLGDAEDFCKMMLSYPGRPIIDFEVCSNTNFSPYAYQVYGTYGSLCGSTSHLDWKYYKPEEAPVLKLTSEPLPGPSYCSDNLKFYEGHWDSCGNWELEAKTMYACIYDNVYDAITKGTALVVTPEQVLQQIAVMEECHRQNPLPRKF